MINSDHLISVIMSVYNDEKNIDKSIKSIMSQTYKNLELHILDDGSDDKTWKIINKYKNEYQNIFIYKNKNNLGLTKSLNYLVNQTNGEIIARHDSDDLSHPERIEKQLNIMTKYNLDFCTTRAQIIQNNKITPKFSYYIPKKIVVKYKNPFIHGTLMIKKRVIINVGMYDENFYYSQDYKLMTDLLNINSKYKILRTPYYKLNFENNISTEFKEEQKYYAFCVKKKLTPHS
tara:strand:+ start:1312 stop:2007 length:696 start_codon:yes stop_codon:yes gene_type:complete